MVTPRRGLVASKAAKALLLFWAASLAAVPCLAAPILQLAGGVEGVMLPLLGGDADVDAVPVVDNGLESPLRGLGAHALAHANAYSEDAFRPAARRRGPLPYQNQPEWRLEDLLQLQGEQDRHDHDLQDEQDEVRYLWERLETLARRAGWREPIPLPPPIPGADDKPCNRDDVNGGLVDAPLRLSLPLGSEPDVDAVATVTRMPPATAWSTDAVATVTRMPSATAQPTDAVARTALL